MRLLALAAASLLGLPIGVFAQNSSSSSSSSSKCFNYGVQTASGSCECPPGFGGTQSKNCDLPVCGGSLYMPKGVGSGEFGNVAQCSCDDGWTGPTCSVCTTHDGCVSSLTKYLGTTSTMALPGMNSTIVCNNQPVVYAASHMQCEVVQSMLQGLFPGRAQLTISRFLNGSSSPGGVGGLNSANIANGVGEVWAQLWLNGTEQFYCHGTECSQTVATNNGANSSDWTCPTLECTCRTGTAFCGGGETAFQNLTLAINPLKGPLSISCTPDGKCFFDQEFLRMFGPQGLPLTGCSFGECLNQYVIDEALGLNAKTGGSGLSGGVIAGLAVVGAILLALLLVMIWGVVVRNKARKAPHDGTLLKRDGVGMSWRNVGYEVGHGHRRTSFYKTFIAWLRGSGGQTSRAQSPHSENGTATTASGSQLVLNDVSGKLPPGAFCCILGPSGAGKSTLVDILAGRRKAGKVTGKVSYLSKNPNRPVKIGYCDQSDVLNPTSTVLETLLFAAYLRLPENVDKKVKEERAHTVLNQLGLSHIANTRVGSGEHRGISGGEMRRVSIGIELVANPDILILDEPTSGLDSVSAARIVSLLKSLTTDPENRTTIVASIHQPSSALYHSFSQVILLSNGRQLYFGPGGNTPAEFFASQGRPCPAGYNIADHLLEVATESEGLKYGANAILPTTGSHESLTAPSDEEKSHSNEHPAHGVPTLSKEVDLAEVGTHDQKRSWWPKDNATTTFLTQFEVIAGREWKMLKRDKTLFFAHFFVFAIVAVFAGGLYFKVSQTISGFQNRIGALFFLGSLIAFGSLSALTLISELRPLFLRERSGGFYSPGAWLLARAVFDIIPLRIIPTIVLSIIVYFMVGLSLNAARFFKYELILILYTLAMVLYNLILGACVEHLSVAILLSSLWNLFNMTFAGFFVNVSSVPKALSWLARLAPLNYCLEAISVNEIPGLSIDDQLSGVPISVTASVIMEILFGFNLSNYYRNVLILFGFIAGFGLILIFAVIFFLRERR